MKKYLLLAVLVMAFVLSGCSQSAEVICGEGTTKVDGQCVVDTLTCDDGFIKEDGACVPEEEEPDTCNTGFHEEDGNCVADEVTCSTGYHEEDNECVPDVVVELPDWFDGWTMLQEPVGDKSVADLTFTETGFSVYLDINQRVGIQMLQLTLETGFSYEVTFDYSSTTSGQGIFVQLQGHGGYVFTNPGVIATETTETFSQTLAMPPEANRTDDGWFTIELTPSGVSGTVTIDNIQITETALPNCEDGQILSGLECIPANNGFDPNGTPTSWFVGWAILSVPAGNKEISDLNFTETGYTTYLAAGERSGIELLDYVFESGYTYELRFDYTATEAGRMVWVQMEALGGYGFTNTETWTINGTATFSQTLTIPDTYVPVEPGWIKIELTPGALDNITIDNIEIIKTAN